MRFTEVMESWVVFKAVVRDGFGGGWAVCMAREWPALAAARRHTLVADGFASHGEAKRMADGANSLQYLGTPRQIAYACWDKPASAQF